MSRPGEPTGEQLRLIYDNTSDLMFLIEVIAPGSYRVASVNQAYLSRTGVARGDIVGLPPERILDGGDAGYVTRRYDDAVAGGGPFNYQTRTLLKGAVVYLDTTLVPVFEGDRCSHLIGVSRDVTESRQEQKALREEKKRAENYLDIAEAVIVALDLDGNITMLNRKGYVMLGYPEGSLTGQCWADVVISPAKVEAFKAAFRRVLNTGVAGSNINYVCTRDGGRILISWSNAVIRDADGEVAGVLSSGEDITDRHRAEQAMIASQRVVAAEEVVLAVAHDFNNSLQGILGNIEIALAVEDRPQQWREHLQTATQLADDAARRLQVLRRAAGQGPAADFEVIDLHELIDDVVAQTQPLWKDDAQRRGHDVTVQRRYSRQVRPITGNRSELRTVLFNIVKNSVEALHGSGEVRFRTYFDDDGFNVITVSDTGVGMDSETSTRIFQPFFSTKGLETGRGLGMSASHSIVQAHSGSISVKRSAPGYGTVIELRLPAAEADAVAQMVPVVGAPSGSHRVLWVDDDPQIRSLAASYVIAMKHRCDVADGGARALELLGRNDYSVVITDIGMPGMNGMELARHIERKTEGRVPVIALTGWGDSVTADGEPPPGIHRVVAKPIRLKRLKEILDELPTAE